MQVTSHSVFLIAILIAPASVLAAEPTPPRRSEIAISAGPWRGTSLPEYLEEMLDYADKVTQRHSRRNVRPSDRLFETAVMRHLGYLSGKREERLLGLLELLGSKDSRVRYLALTLIHRDWNVDSRFSTQLLKDNSAFQSRITELLRDEIWETTEAAALHLAVLNPQAWPPALADYVVEQLQSGDTAAQVRAARLVRTATNPPAGAEAPLLAALQRQPAGVARTDFAWALFHYGKVPAESVPDFITAVRASATRRQVSGGMCCAPSGIANERQMDNLRREFQAILPRLGVDAAPAIPVLIELLKDHDIETRRVAVVTLGKFGPLAKAALPSLTTMKTEHVEERYVRPGVIFGQSYGGTTRFVTRIDGEVASAYQQIAGKPMYVAFPQGLPDFAFEVFRSWTRLLQSLDKACPEFKHFIRERPEVRQLTVTLAVFAASVSPRSAE